MLTGYKLLNWFYNWMGQVWLMQLTLWTKEVASRTYVLTFAATENYTRLIHLIVFAIPQT